MFHVFGYLYPLHGLTHIYRLFSLFLNRYYLVDGQWWTSRAAVLVAVCGRKEIGEKHSITATEALCQVSHVRLTNTMVC